MFPVVLLIFKRPLIEFIIGYSSLNSLSSSSCYAAAHLLAFWYSHQQVVARWQNVFFQNVLVLLAASGKVVCYRRTYLNCM